ncbi:MAG: hypothetical protein AB7L84_02555 [Acidimicrobiia bacterium]
MSPTPARQPVRAPVRARPVPAPVEPPRHLRVVRAPERARRLTPRTGVVATVLVFLGLLALAVSQALLVQGQARLDELDRALAAERDEYQALRQQVADLESPRRIVDTATRDLGMVAPSDLVYLSPRAPLSGDAADAAGTGDAAGAGTASGGDIWAATKPLLEITGP